MLKSLQGWIKNKFKSDFTRNLGWLGGAQAFIRVSRLAATVILPRFLTPHDYGIAALVLTTFEFTQTFTRIGIIAKIIQADDQEVEGISNSAYWLNWVLYSSLFVIQCIAAFPIAWFYQDNQLIVPICVLGLTYLIAPIGRVQSALIQREKRMNVIAIAQAARYATANVLTAILAVFGWGMWAIILPILLASPIEFIIYQKYHSWKLTEGFTTRYWKKIFVFGVNVLGTQLLKTLRENMDYLIIGRFLGVKELGVYFFAFNGGLGVSLTIIQSINMALYPHLCAVRGKYPEFKATYFKSLRTIAKVIIPFVLLQSCLAPFYVPLIFGEQWVPAIPILILICLSAIPRPFNTAAFQILAVIDKPQIALYQDVIFTVIFGLSLLAGIQGGILGVAIAVLAVHLIVVPIFVIWATHYVFYRKEVLEQVKASQSE